MPPTHAYLFSSGGTLLGSAPVTEGVATVNVPVEADGQMAEVFLGPPAEHGRPTPTAPSMRRAGAFNTRTRIVAKTPVDLPVISELLKNWCSCTVRGRLVKRYTTPDGTNTERVVCNARVTICEVDHFWSILAKVPDREVVKLRDDLLDKLRAIPKVPPLPIPEPDPPFRPMRVEASAALAQGPLQAVSLHALAAATSPVAIRRLLVQNANALALYLDVLEFLLPYLTKECITTVEADEQGRFTSQIWHDCDDTPDLYFSVEQLREGMWETVYRPTTWAGTHWNYPCGTEVVLDVPDATPCDEPTYDLPRGVTLFVLPYAIGYTPIWGRPGTSFIPMPAPHGWLRADGKVDYDTGSSLGRLYDAPFGGTLDFIHDDSYFMPSDELRYYRYSFRRHQPGQPENTGADDTTWTPIATPLARWYRIEFDDGRLPIYDAHPVGPHTVGGRSGLFEFKPQTPPCNPDEANVAKCEWVSGNLSEAAARWNTTGVAPALSKENAVDDAGVFEVKIEVFDAAGNPVVPGPGTFRFIGLNEDRTTTRLATDAEVDEGAYVLRVHVDNNLPIIELPQPSIGGVGAGEDCGFLRYGPGSTVLVAFKAQHPNQHAVFQFGITRGSGRLTSASTTPPYVEIGPNQAPTSSAPYVESGGYYQRGFAPAELVGTCVDAAFAASLSIFGKATNGYHRLHLDAYRLIAFALARDESP